MIKTSPSLPPTDSFPNLLVPVDEKHPPKEMLDVDDHPTGQRGDRPGSWTPPDINDGAKALFEMWRNEPDAIEKNRVRALLAVKVSF